MRKSDKNFALGKYYKIYKDKYLEKNITRRNN